MGPRARLFAVGAVERERLSYAPEDRLGLRIANFCAVIRDAAEPRVSGRDGLKTLRVIDAIKRAADCGPRIAV
jgi:hypothetical protein